MKYLASSLSFSGNGVKPLEGKDRLAALKLRTKMFSDIAAVLEKVDGDGTNWRGKVEKMEAEEREEELKEEPGKRNSVDKLIEYNEESEN